MKLIEAKTYNVNPNDIPRRVHFYGPDSPCQVFIPLCVLTGLTYFYLKQQTVAVKVRPPLSGRPSDGNRTLKA